MSIWDDMIEDSMLCAFDRNPEMFPAVRAVHSKMLDGFYEQSMVDSVGQRARGENFLR